MTVTVDKVATDLFGEPDPVEFVNADDLAEEFDPTPHEHLDHPVEWTEQGGEELWSKQREVQESVVANRYTAVHSAHDTGKSFNAARLVCWWLDVHKAGEAFAVTTAPTWQQVHAILWREIRQAKMSRDLRGRTTLDARWYIGGSRPGDELEQLVAYGRKPADYNQAAFQGIHAKYVLVIIDEASGIPKLLYDAVDSLATNQYARVLAIGNPDDPASEFHNVCKPGSGWNTIHISAFDTPAFTGEDVSEDLLDLLVSQEWVEERKKRWGEASPTYISKVLGEFPEIGEDTLISPALLRQAELLDLSGKARAKGQEGWDIARYGSDKTVGYRNRGGLIRKVYEGIKQDTMATAGRIKRSIGPSHGGVPAVVDVVGLGGGVVDRLREQKVKGVIAFNAGEKASEPDRFDDRRAEVYWGFREALENGEIDLPVQGEDEDLKAQLGSIKWYITSKGKVRIESKDDMKKRGLPSPDHADACVQSWWPGALRLPSRDAIQAQASRDTITGDLLTREL